MPYLNYLLLFTILVLTFLLLRLFLKKSFELRKTSRQSPNYPKVLAITLVFLAFSLLFANDYLIGIAVQIINQYSNLDLKPPSNELNLVAYGLFCALAAWMIWVDYKNAVTFVQKNPLEKTLEDTGLKITPPPEIPKESSIFHERMKALFELKYPKLQLDYDQEDKILYGQYQSGLRTYSVLAYCDATVAAKQIDKGYQENVLGLIRFFSNRIPNYQKDSIED